MEVIIYTKSHCPFCVRAKDLLTDRGIIFTQKDANEHAKEFAELKKKYDHHTVPMIFMDGEMIGGFDTLKMMDNNGLL